MDSCLQLNSLVLNNVQMPITASLALGEDIMIHSHIKCLVSGLSSAWAFPPVKAYTGCVFSRDTSTFLTGIEYEFKDLSGMMAKHSQSSSRHQAS